MAETNTAGEKQFAIQKLYVKDISFESPNAPKIFTQKWEASLDLNIGTHVDNLENSVYEVSLSITATVKVGDTVAYLVEIKQAGIFTISGFSEQEMGPMLGVFCPNILFPYAREAITDIVTKGGFPQLILAPVNFDAMYLQQMQQNQQNGESKTLN